MMCVGLCGAEAMEAMEALDSQQEEKSPGVWSIWKVASRSGNSRGLSWITVDPDLPWGRCDDELIVNECID